MLIPTFLRDKEPNSERDGVAERNESGQFFALLFQIIKGVRGLIQEMEATTGRKSISDVCFQMAEEALRQAEKEFVFMKEQLKQMRQELGSFLKEIRKWME